MLTQNAAHIPLAVLHCQHSDLASGLYDALKQSTDEYRNFMTTSEIKLLANYIESQIEHTPEKITMGLHNWCSIDYNTEDFNFYETSDYDDDYLLSRNVTFVCSKTNHNEAFDYRGELSQIGLDIILAYAYNANHLNDETTSTSSSSSSSSSSQTQQTYDYNFFSDEEYADNLKARNKVLHQYVELLSVIFTIQVIMFFSSFVYYSLRGDEMNDESVPILFKNFFAILSSSNLILSFSAFLVIVVQIHTLQIAIKNELSAYGIYLKYGAKFMIISVFWIIFTFFACLLWAGPIWCNRSIKTHKIEDNQIPLSMEAYDYNYNYVDADEGDDQDEGNEINTTFNNNEDEDEEEDDDHTISKGKYDFKDSTSQMSSESEKIDPRIIIHSKSRTASLSSNDIEMDTRVNPFEEVETSLPQPHPIYQNKSYNHSELSLKRKPPPRQASSTLNNENLIPMSPILPRSPSKKGVIKPNVLVSK